MKALLPILKTKLVLLSFISACTVILATTVPQIRNFIAPEKALGEKITTEQKKVAPKIKKQNKTVSASRLTSGLLLEMNNSFEATVKTDKDDYAPGERLYITGSGWIPGDTVTLRITETPTLCPNGHTLYAVADASGEIHNEQWVFNDSHIGLTFLLTATSQTSGLTAQTTFTDGVVFPSGIDIDPATPQNVCQNAPINQLTAEISTCEQGGGATSYRAITYTWYYNTTNSNSIIGATQVGTPTSTDASTVTDSYTPSAATVGTRYYFCQVTFIPRTGSGGQCGQANAPGYPFTTATVQVTVNQAPTCSITGTSGPVCPSSSNDYTAPANMSSYLWQVTSGTATIVAGEEDDRIATVTADALCDDSYILKLTITDANGCTSTCSQTVTVDDNTVPELTVPANTTAECSALPAAGADGDATATDNCDATPTVTYEGEQSTKTNNGSCTDQNYTLTRTWKAVDNCGNSSTKSQTITVSDNTAPVLTVPANTTAECSALPAAGADGDATATDNCDATPTVIYEGEQSTKTNNGSCTDQNYTLTRTWKAVDNCGNSSTKSQVITVSDNTAPVLTVPANTTAECSALPAAGVAGDASATDNCDATPEVTYEGEVSTKTNNGSCTDQNYTLTRTWKAVDNCGNSSTKSQVITVSDNTAPVLTVPANTTAECSALPAAGVAGDATATDNCDATPEVTYEGEVSTKTNNGSCTDQNYTLTRTWKAVDNCGNSSTKSQVITVSDNTAPVLTVPANTTAECSALPAAGADGDATATDNCDATPTVIYEGEQSTKTNNGSCTDQNYTLTRTWKAVDNCGNSSTKSQTITVSDNTAPVLTVPANTTAECSALPAAGADGDATATDNCDATPTVTYEGEQSTKTNNGSCTDQNYTLTRTWKAVDNCGNSSTKSQTITVSDNTAPVLTVPANTTAECSALPSAGVAGDASATDNCDATPTVTYEGEQSTKTNNGSCTDQNYTLTRTWKAVDNCGNSSTKSQVITVSDNTAPVLTVPANTTAECSALPSAGVAGDASATDNCDATPEVTYEGEVSTKTNNGSCTDQNYTLTRTWKAVDNCGNSSTKSQVITVSDNTAPVLTVPANTTAECSALPSAGVAGDASATDNCDATPEVTYEGEVSTKTNNGSCTDQNYTLTRTWKAVDNCGNSSTKSQVITVSDNTAPVLTVPANTTAECSALPSAGVAGDASATDNCDATPEVTYEGEVSTKTNNGSCTDQNYTLTRTWKAVDNCGNSSTKSQVITVSDNTAPVLTVPANTTAECSALPSAGVAGDASATDNCDATPEVTYEGEVSTKTNNGSCTDQNYTLTRTWKAVDNCGNSSTKSQVITVSDNTAPVLTVPANTTAECSALPSAGVAGDASATDNCDATPEVTYEGEVSTKTNNGSCTDQNYTLTRTWKAVDNCGNSSTKSQVITVSDNTAPVLTVPANTTAECSALPSAGVAGDASATDNCDATPEVTYEGEVSTKTNNGSCTDQNYTLTRTWKAVDNCGNSSTKSQVITVSDNTAPLISATGTTLTLGCNPSASDINAALGSASATDNCGLTTVTPVDDPVQSTNCSRSQKRTFTANDACGNTSTTSRTVTWTSDLTPPNVGVVADKTSLWPPNHKMVPIIITPTASDGCGSIASTSLVVTSNEPANDIGDGNTEEDIAWTGGVVQPGDPYTVKGPITVGTDGTYRIQLRAERSGVNAETGRIYTIYYIATDACGNTNSASTQVTVAHNITGPNPGNAYEINSTVNLAGTFWDVPGKTHTAKWVVDGTTINGTVTAEPSGNKMGKVTGSFKPTVAGVYKLRMNVTDQSGVTSYATTSGDYEAYFVAFDPKGGFTYGGGQFTSPAGALPARPNLTSTVTFGFASNYYKNATNPKGETQIDLKLTDGDYSFAFNALNYDYLVANGANATYKGLGKTTINGVEQSGLAFILKVIDGKTATNPDGVDKIRMKIYNKNTGAVIYDNQMGASETADPTTPVDQPKADGTDIVVVSNPATTTNITAQNTQMETVAPDITKFNVKAFPNPSEHVFSLVLENATNERVQIVVYDAVGRQVKMFEKESANIPIRFGADLKTGAYIVEVRQGDNRKTLKLVKQ